MKTTASHDERIAKMTFSSVYPHYVTKVEKKGRTKEELHEVIEWLTGYNGKKLQKLIDDKVTFEQFFKNAKLNTNAHLITGVICGYRVEEIDNPLTRQTRITPVGTGQSCSLWNSSTLSQKLWRATLV